MRKLLLLIKGAVSSVGLQGCQQPPPPKPVVYYPAPYAARNVTCHREPNGDLNCVRY